PIFYICCMHYYATVGAIGIHKIKIQNKIIIFIFAPKGFIFSGRENTAGIAPYTRRKNGIAEIFIKHGMPSAGGRIGMDIGGILCKAGACNSRNYYYYKKCNNFHKK